MQDIIKVYQTAAGGFEALKGVTLNIKRGEFVGIIGKSGAGKSTLINMLTGVDDLTDGEIWVETKAIHKMSENEMALWRGLNMGVVYQSFQLLPKLSLLDNILLPMDFCGLYKPRLSKDRAMHLLELVELEEHARKLPSAVSGGQAQRAAIARALANDPPIIVADEPTGNLDSNTAEAIFELFENLVEQGKTLIMVSHDKGLSRRATHTINISDGVVVDENYK